MLSPLRARGNLLELVLIAYWPFEKVTGSYACSDDEQHKVQIKYKYLSTDAEHSVTALKDNPTQKSHCVSCGQKTR